MWLQKGGTKKDKSNTILFWWATLWKKQINNKSRWPRLGAAMRDLTVSIKIYSTKKRKVWTQTVWQTQISVIHQSVDFSELTSVCRTNLKAVCLLNIWVIFTVQISWEKENNPKYIVVKGLHNADAKMLTSVMGLNSLWGTQMELLMTTCPSFTNKHCVPHKS